MQKKLFQFGQYILGSAFVIFLPVLAHAKGLGDALKNVSPIGGAAGMKNDISALTGTIIKGALSLIGLIFFLLMVYAGYLWMTARGESDPVDKAREIFKQSIIGLIIVVSAYAITIFVTKKIGA